MCTTLSIFNFVLLTLQRGLKVLLAHPDIRVNVVDQTGRTAVQQAARNGHEECLKMLLAHPQTTTANIANCSHETALDKAKQVLQFYESRASREERNPFTEEIETQQNVIALLEKAGGLSGRGVQEQASGLLNELAVGIRSDVDDRFCAPCEKNNVKDGNKLPRLHLRFTRPGSPPVTWTKMRHLISRTTSDKAVLSSALFQVCEEGCLPGLWALLPHLDACVVNFVQYASNFMFQTALDTVWKSCQTAVDSTKKKDYQRIADILANAGARTYAQITLDECAGSSASMDVVSKELKLGYALFTAADTGNDLDVRQLVETDGIDVNFTKGWSHTALDYAHPSVVSTLRQACGKTYDELGRPGSPRSSVASADAVDLQVDDGRRSSGCSCCRACTTSPRRWQCDNGQYDDLSAYMDEFISYGGFSVPDYATAPTREFLAEQQSSCAANVLRAGGKEKATRQDWDIIKQATTGGVKSIQAVQDVLNRTDLDVTKQYPGDNLLGTTVLHMFVHHGQLAALQKISDVTHFNVRDALDLDKDKTRAYKKYKMSF